MATIQVKNVPEETHHVLRLRATAAHMSLQEYLRARLIEDAATPSLEEVFTRVDLHTGGVAPLAVTADVVRSDRDRR